MKTLEELSKEQEQLTKQIADTTSIRKQNELYKQLVVVLLQKKEIYKQKLDNLKRNL